MIAELILNHSSTTRIPSEQYPFRVYNLLKTQGFKPDKFKYIHVTGSKGKGSIVRTCFDLLKSEGKNVGVFMSPHILDICERFETSDGVITTDKLTELFTIYKQLFIDNELHFFEICLFLALVYFTEKKCEFVVLEVGIGGRFDPTNFCTPLVSLLAHVSMEHTDFLGDTIEKIAFDKAGIIKKGVPAISVPQDPQVEKIFLQEGHVDFIKPEFNIIHGKTHIVCKPPMILDRLGKANVYNFWVALHGILKILPTISAKTIQKITHTKVPYRLDLIQKNILVDTAHNGASFLNLMDCIENWLHWKHITLCITIIKGKELDHICEALQQYQHLIQNIVVFDFGDKSHGKELYHKLTSNFTNITYQEQLTEIPQHQKLVIAGSFYSLQYILPLIK